MLLQSTTFTFSPVFFEEECLSRFLGLETDPVEDGPLYIVEREEKLASLSCVSAIVDQHHCRGSRNLRWDLLPARPKKGVLHAKIALLHWSNLVRILFTSANISPDLADGKHPVASIPGFHSSRRPSTADV